MKKIISIILLALTAGMASAQPAYKYVVQHLDEYTDREALYLLHDYQRSNPQRPHVYYLMANINYKMQVNEHALVDYDEKAKMLYDARVYYGNCRAYLSNDKINETLYPRVAEVYKKVNEESVSAWLTSKIDTLSMMQEQLDSLYVSYSELVTRYDACVQMFSLFMSRYSRQKDAQMMLAEEDTYLLDSLRQAATRLPDLIKRFQDRLAVMPIEGYEPVFHFRPISYFRLEGLTCTDFLKNEISLWDYATWVDAFMAEQERVAVIKRLLYAEHSALEKMNASSEKHGRENVLVLNQVRQYDEGSPIADLVHYDYLINTMNELVGRIVPTDSVQITEEEWLGCLQLAERHMRVVEQCRDMEKHLQDVFRQQYDDIVAKYGEFVLDKQGVFWLPQLLQDYRVAYQHSEDFLREWLMAQTDMPHEVQIDENRVAVVTEEGLTFRSIDEIF